MNGKIRNGRKFCRMSGRKNGAEKEERLIRKIGEDILSAVYPRRCPVCDGILLPGESFLCSACQKELRPVSGPRCMKCSRPVGEQEEYCRECRKQRDKFDSGFAPYGYHGVMQQSLMRFKYQGRMEYGRFYAHSIAMEGGQKLLAMKPEVLVPVPIHPARRAKRGYNQAEVLARELAKELGLPVDTKHLIRIRKTTAQKKLGREERRKNLEKAFAVKGPLPYRRILLVDDIFTTGSTVNAISILLKKKGAERVDFVTVAIVQ